MHSYESNNELQFILEGTVKETGENFFNALVQNLCKAINTYGAWVTEYIPEEKQLRALAFWLDDKFVPEYEYLITNTPCEAVISDAKYVHIPDNVIELYPNDPDLPRMNAVSYLGTPFVDEDGTILGHIAVLHDKPLPEDQRITSIFNIFADRAAAELKRLRALKKLKEREEKLSRLIDCTMDAFLEFNDAGVLTLVNPAAEKLLKSKTGNLIGKNVRNLLTKDSAQKISVLKQQINSTNSKGNYLWISGGLQVIIAEDESFFAEASLSSYKINNNSYYILILRNIEERLKAEQQINDLTNTAYYLNEQIRELNNYDEIIGKSPLLISALEEIENVADTDTTVLILGETGTGKELFARAIHNRSYRKNKPLIKLNCAAMPAELIESELFGHEQGAFTGATKKREGRFKLADRGTIFLDEIGELPLALQAKLLRVLQEKEFEPVGSSLTEKVDVRVIAATNRDLEEEVKKGNFREDLYYRLNVYPIQIPSLRERGDDIILLAENFAKKFSAKLSKKIEPLTEEAKIRLRSYKWPGNIRELQNVIERAVITSKKGWLNLSLLQPENKTISQIPLKEPTTIKTHSEILDFERSNIIAALKACNWKVSGKNGAANLIGIPPTTLSSKIKSFNIIRDNS
ncbi:MAG: sigma 54-interacting transcriptional regulator [Melioribacteraceae bacterium]|nr:sigma 54-interacting transcriptional regulator [Melioribacteraceae bacterium]